MATFLISTMPAAGHVTPARALSASLVRRGHEVLWHTWPEFRQVVEATGARFEPARHTPSFLDLPPSPDGGKSGPAAAVQALKRLMVDRMVGQVADYEDILSRQRFDCMVVDLCALGGRAFHERTGIPWATLGISPLAIPSPDIPPFGSGKQPPRGALGRLANAVYWQLGKRLLREVTTSYEAERAKVGLPGLPSGRTVFDHMVSEQLHLQASSPSLEFPRRPWPRHVRLVGPLLPPLDRQSEEQLPSWWPELEGRRVVHVTQGSVATEVDLLTLPAVEALRELDVLVVVTTPAPEELRSVPPNVRVALPSPHGLLLPHVSAMVTNAGYNGVKAALAHGVPLVMAPWGNDQPDVAARVSRIGAGIDLHKRTPSPSEIRKAVSEVLRNPRYGKAAERVAREFDAYPGGELAADALEGLVGTPCPPR